MNKLLLSALLTFPLLLTCGCSGPNYSGLLPYTDDLASQYALNNQDKRRLQYFVNGDITLVRAVTSGERKIDKGKLIQRSGKWVQEVLVKNGSPGVVLASGADWLAVSFEKGTYLYFTSRPQNHGWLHPDEEENHRYYLFSPDWNGRSGSVSYNRQGFEAVDNSWDAYLEVDEDAFSEVQGARSILPGRLLGK